MIDVELLVVQVVRRVDGLNVFAVSFGLLFLFLQLEEPQDADKYDEDDTTKNTAHDKTKSPR